MKKQNIFFFLFLLGFLALEVFIQTGKIAWLDQQAFQFFRSYRSSQCDLFFLVITNIMNGIILCCLCLLAILFWKKYHLFIFGNLLGSVLVVHLLKFIIQRPRPIGNRLSEVGFSNPSAHAFIAFSVFGLFIYLLLKDKKSIRNICFSIFLISIIFLIGASRIYFEVHYLSDILTGYFAGGAYLIVYLWIGEKYHLLDFS